MPPKAIISLVCLPLAIALKCVAAASLLRSPLPPAEGFGASAEGGAGGTTIWVTNLNSHGPGSLRAAIDTRGRRAIKFEVAGTIELRRDSIVIGGPFRTQWESRIRAGQPPPLNPYSNVTVDGSSAPTPGITISGCVFLQYGASHVVLRHLRTRDNGFVRTNFGTGITVADGSHHVLIDHCSLSWGRTKMITFYGACSNIALQWCIIADANKACFVANGADRVSIHHSLFANCGDRPPAIGGGVDPKTGEPLVRLNRKVNRTPEDFANARPAASILIEGAASPVRLRATAADRDGQIVSYTWYFGDGSYGVGASVKHAYRIPDEYIATLFAMDQLGMTGMARARAPVRADGSVRAELLALPPAPTTLGPTPIAHEPAVTVRVPRRASPGASDTFLSQTHWRGACELTPFVNFNTWRLVPEGEIVARALHDGERLHLIIDVANPWPGSVRPARRAETEIWLRGGVEVYLSPRWGSGPWFALVVNRIGVMYDAKGFDHGWDPPVPWQARSREEDGRWIIEIVIPFRSFGMDATRTDSAFGLKLCRMSQQTPGRDGGPWIRQRTAIWPTLAPTPRNRHSVTYSPDPGVYAEVVPE